MDSVGVDILSSNPSSQGYLRLYFLLLAVIHMSKRVPSLLNLLPRCLRARAQLLTSSLPSVLPPWTQPFLLQGPLDSHLGLAIVLSFLPVAWS